MKVPVTKRRWKVIKRKARIKAYRFMMECVGYYNENAERPPAL